MNRNRAVPFLYYAILFMAVFFSIAGRESSLRAVPYGSVPKGLTLEGNAEGMEALNTVSYDRKTNTFRLNQSADYLSPVPRDELARVLRAMIRDDRLGVSITRGETLIAYGALRKDGLVAKALEKGDRLLGGVVFARWDWLDGVRLPDKYQPARVPERTIPTACHFNLHEFMFEKNKEKQYVRTSVALTIRLIPIAREKAKDGGFLPDYKAIENGVFEKEDMQNVKHVEAHRAEYLDMPSMKKAVALGETAAFLRHVRDSGISLKTLYRAVR